MIAPLVIAAVALVVQRPTMLIYQESVVEFTDTDPNVIVSKKLGEMLDKNGKVAPIVWTKDDPAIAAAVAGGKLPGLPAAAKRQEVLGISKILGASYVAFVELRRTGAELNGKIDVVRASGGRSLWKNETKVSVMNGGRLDAESGVLSIANTWTIQLNANPFKDLAARPIFENPAVSNPSFTPSATGSIDNTPLASGLKALEEGRLVAAVALLHDAVDVEPMSVKARLAYIDALRQSGHPFLAADEAARAAELMPQEGTFLVAAAQAWIEGGKPDKAHDLIRNALASEPKNASALSLLGDLYVGRLELDGAIDAYTKSFEAKQDPETLYKRAQALAIAERFDESIADIERANSAGLSREPAQAEKRYRETVKTLDPVIESLAANERNLLREAGDGKPTTDLKGRSASFTKRIESFLGYLDRIEAPETHLRSHTRRELAVSLLHQSAQGLAKFLAGDTADALGDAEILQIEAMREFAVAKQQFQAEIGD
jgi:tetratricopeptide (TPR) repeat protein